VPLFRRVHGSPRRVAADWKSRACQDESALRVVGTIALRRVTGPNPASLRSFRRPDIPPIGRFLSYTFEYDRGLGLG
jgi:hypothetical protein